MNYEDLKISISEILNNENITKNGLVITYKLRPKVFKELYLSFISDINGEIINEIEEFEINIDGLIVKCEQDAKKG